MNDEEAEDLKELIGIGPLRGEGEEEENGQDGVRCCYLDHAGAPIPPKSLITSILNDLM